MSTGLVRNFESEKNIYGPKVLEKKKEGEKKEAWYSSFEEQEMQSCTKQC